MKIKFAKPIIGKKEINNVVQTLKTGILVHGKKTKTFEKKMSNFFNSSQYSVTTASSCTAAMHLFYFVKKIKKNDEIICPAQSHVATAHAIELAGGKPVFVDSNNFDGNIDINLIEKNITKKTVGISLTHFLGKPVQMNRVIKIANKYGLFVVEDCALALGSRINKQHVGTFGDIGAFSFHPVKLITTAEGGALICKNKKTFNLIESAKAFGYDISDPSKRLKGSYNVNYLGFNYRMNEIEASIGIEQLKKINLLLKKRKKNYDFLYNKLKKLDTIKILNTGSEHGIKSSYYALTIICKSKFIRDKYILKLKSIGIGTSIYYPHPIPVLNYYKKKYKLKSSKFPNACEISYKGICLPVGPHLGFSDMSLIFNSLQKIINEKL
jgi:perosamine synthetase|tara:strand:- start:24067 stop:25212 length:1146 start_codon:yes stop_codon:yes gene_type:complete